MSDQSHLPNQPQQPQQPQQPVPPSRPAAGSSSFGNAAPVPPQDRTGFPAGSTGVYAPVNQAPVPPTSHAAASGAAGYGGPRVPSTPSPKGDHVFAKAFGGAALAVVLGLGGFAAVQGATGQGSRASNVTLGSSNPSTIEATDPDQTLSEAVAEKTLPSVVCIYAYTQSTPYGNGSFGFGQNGGSTELSQSSLGSGIILSQDGYILTNYHVIEGSDALKVNIEGTEYSADIVGSDPSSDLAVIKLQGASGLKAADLGDSSKLTVGQWVMTIGSPFGLEQSVATGVVSATSRSQIVDNSQSEGAGNWSNMASGSTIYPNMIQTDAAINPGNSGGALVDADGKVIGVNTLITSSSGNYSGVGFAIPVNYAINIAQQIIAGETPTHARLGATLNTVNASIAKRYNLPVSQGAYVASVSASTGADRAGLKEGDIVTAFDGKAVTDASDLMLDVREHNPGDTVTVTVNRDGQTLDLTVTLGSDAETSTASASSQKLSGSSQS